MADAMQGSTLLMQRAGYLLAMLVWMRGLFLARARLGKALASAP
ncbi:hypothetical protein [Mesorhizobium neociceri]|nr:hypothetical protein [Mesorhizobium neociceri]